MNDQLLYRQYLLEKELAQIIRASSTKGRRGIYSEVYDRFFHELSSERKQIMVRTPEQQLQITNLQLKAIRPLISTKDGVFLEIGSGGTDFSAAVAIEFEEVIALEASAKMISDSEFPQNLTFAIADAPPYPLLDSSVDLAFCSHFIEHLQPEDALLHFKEIHRI